MNFRIETTWWSYTQNTIVDFDEFKLMNPFFKYTETSIGYVVRAPFGHFYLSRDLWKDS